MRKLIIVMAAALWGCSSDDPKESTREADNTSCLQIKNTRPSSASGVYRVGPLTCGNAVVPVYCDMDTDGGGWTMVLKLSAGVPGDPYDIWMGSALNDTDESLLGTDLSASHYLSRVVPGWDGSCGYGFSEAAIRFYAGGALADKYFAFDTTGTTKESWFSAAHLTGSAYSTPPDAFNTAGTGGYFSIAGDGRGYRRFFINESYGGGCSLDAGWLVARGSGTTAFGICPWEGSGTGVLIGYSAGSGSATWYTVGTARPDVMAIYVR